MNKVQWTHPCNFHWFSQTVLFNRNAIYPDIQNLSKTYTKSLRFMLKLTTNSETIQTRQGDTISPKLPISVLEVVFKKLFICVWRWYRLVIEYFAGIGGKDKRTKTCFKTSETERVHPENQNYECLLLYMPNTQHRTRKGKSTSRSNKKISFNVVRFGTTYSYPKTQGTL